MSITFYVAQAAPIFLPLSAAFPHDTDSPFPPPVVPTPPLNVVTVPPVPFEDTLRGGLLVTIGGRDLTYFAMDRDMLSLSLPPGLTVFETGAAFATPTLSGLSARTGGAAGSSIYFQTGAGYTYGANYAYYDLSVDSEPLLPNVNTQAGPIVLAFLEGRTSGGDRAYVRVVHDSNVPEGYLRVEGRATSVSAGELGAGSALLPDPGPRRQIRLRLVRNGELIYGFVGTVDLIEDVMETAYRVLETPYFSATAGPLRFGADNQSVAVRIHTRFTNFRFRPGASVDGYLLDGLTVVGARRLYGYIPEARFELSDLGLHDLDLFGVWGRTRLSNGFEYVMPTPKTVGRTFVSTLDTANDPQVRNDE